MGAFTVSSRALLLSSLAHRYERVVRPTPASQRIDGRLLSRVVKIKRELSLRYLRSGVSKYVHAVGVGMLENSDEYCIQVFRNRTQKQAANFPMPTSYRGVSVVPIEMPRASLMSDDLSSSGCNGPRESQDVIIGGISAAHTNLTNQNGTIGYFCTSRSKLPGRKEIYLLSTSHIFTDLLKTRVDDNDLIMQPSPGEATSNRPIGTLVSFSPLKFDGDIDEPNYIDAAIARLWASVRHEPLLPVIGKVKSCVEKREVKIGKVVRKVGRSTGYTEGRVLSICLDIWIRYDRTGQSAYFENQFLIEPRRPAFTKFVSKGDSGSLVVDTEQNAVALIFAGMSETTAGNDTEAGTVKNSTAERPKRIEGYGVANPITEVLNRLNIDLVLDRT